MDTNTELYHDVPCSSIAVESIISVGTGGLIWGLCSGSYDAKQKGKLIAYRFHFHNCQCLICFTLVNDLLLDMMFSTLGFLKLPLFPFFYTPKILFSTLVA
ncbi:putative mitochondrial import inner membrane translocase subunit TIM22 [Helianthus anomalus]